ncbi:cupin domain-containing protein [Massilia antarctica]|uniref:Cupin domain-containing protein n=1 Tax=Massilia antarctica TaxID=2765360 RepID=A0AA49A6N9_9BURK|nr:cupin domain-containing protein [Massilia antarctica]QPI48588.1 cupin domain-containing protein [Massilia antarctica]
MSTSLEPSAPHLRAQPIAVPDPGVELFAYPEVAGFPGGFQYFEVQPGAETPLDRHASQEVWTIQAGAGELYFADAWHPLKAGDCVHFPALKPHRMRNSGAQPMRIFALWWRSEHAAP